MLEASLFDKFFRDEKGNIVIAQPPNIPLITWFVATVLRVFPLPPNFATILDAVAFGALFAWAWMELFQGVNYFRRSLGLLVLFLAIASKGPWAA